MSHDERPPYGLVKADWFQGNLVLHVRNEESGATYQNVFSAEDAVDIAEAVMEKVIQEGSA